MLRKIHPLKSIHCSHFYHSFGDLRSYPWALFRAMTDEIPVPFRCIVVMVKAWLVLVILSTVGYVVVIIVAQNSSYPPPKCWRLYLLLLIYRYLLLGSFNQIPILLLAMSLLLVISLFVRLSTILPILFNHRHPLCRMYPYTTSDLYNWLNNAICHPRSTTFHF